MKTIYKKEKEFTKADKYLAAENDKYTFKVSIKLVFDHGFKWIMNTNDLSVMTKGLFSLPELILDFIESFEENNPRYTRLEENAMYKIEYMKKKMDILVEAAHGLRYI